MKFQIQKRTKTSRIYKELLQLNNKKKKTTNFKLGSRCWKISNDMQMTKKHMKICSISLIIREIQVKTQWAITSPIRMATIKKKTENKCWQHCAKTGAFVHCWWDCKIMYPIWKVVWGFLKKLKIQLPLWSTKSESWVYIQMS